MGDTAWAFFHDSREEKYDGAGALRYLDARAAQGFNVIHCMMLSEVGDGNSGGKPWIDLSAENLNPGYWQQVDQRIAYANSKGIVVGLAVAWADKRKQEPFAWCLAQPGKQYVLYARGLADSMELTLEGGHYTARQFNPRTGEFTDLSKPNGAMPFHYRPPDQQDWVVLLQEEKLK
jgi:hypothetical protein